MLAKNFEVNSCSFLSSHFSCAAFGTFLMIGMVNDCNPNWISVASWRNKLSQTHKPVAVVAFGFSDLIAVIPSISHLAFYGQSCVSASASAIIWFRSKCFCAGHSFPSGVASDSGTDVSGKQRASSRLISDSHYKHCSRCKRY